MPVRDSKSSLKLMSTLINNKTEVNEDTLLLINASEVLTKEGIHGVIAPIGVGFGTGRHLSKR